MKPLRIAFAGTPDFAAVSLAALLDQAAGDNGHQDGHQVVAVLTQPDRAAGRRKKIIQSPVKQLAVDHDLLVLQPETLKDEEIQTRLRDLDLDVLVVVAYGLIIPRVVLDIPRLGGVNVHGSLLPRWRGAAPIEYAIMAGDERTGTTIMKMDVGLDTGPMLLAESLEIGQRETGGELHDRLAEQGARLLQRVLQDLPGHLQNAQPQPDQGVTYAPKLHKPDARLDFRLPARGLVCRIRALNPRIVSWVEFDGQPLRVWQADEDSVHSDETPGAIVDVSDHGLTVATGDGTVVLTDVQLSGKRPMSVAEIRRGHPNLFRTGVVLD